MSAIHENEVRQSIPETLPDRISLLARGELERTEGLWGGEGIDWEETKSFLQGLSGIPADENIISGLNKARRLEEIYDTKTVFYLLGKTAGKSLNKGRPPMAGFVGTEGMETNEEGVLADIWGDTDVRNHQKISETINTRYLPAVEKLRERLAADVDRDRLDIKDIYPQVRSAAKAVGKIVSYRTKLANEGGRGNADFVRETAELPYKPFIVVATSAAVLAACAPFPPAIVQEYQTENPAPQQNGEVIADTGKQDETGQQEVVPNQIPANQPSAEGGQSLPAVGDEPTDPEKTALAQDLAELVLTEEAREVIEPIAGNINRLMRQAIEQGEESFKLIDPNGMEVVIDVPSNEEARQEIETHRATWDWELRGYVRQDPETGRLQVLRYYDEKGKWIEVADTFDIPGWGKLTIEGDLDALANPEFENILPVKNPRFTKSEQSLQQWQNGLSHWSQDDTIINLKQVDNFTKASTMDTFRMNYPVEQADLENGITLELLPGYDSKQAKNSKFADEAVYESWFARTEGGRLIISFYVNYVDTTELARKVLERYPNINSVDLNILPIAVINWINNEPNNLQISKAGRVVDYNTKEGKLLPGVAETMMAFFDFEPSTSMELISQLNNYIIEVDR